MRRRESKASEYVVEELCMDDECKRAGSHYHPLDLDSLRRDGAAADEGLGVQYTLTVRVRKRRRPGRRPRPVAKPRPVLRAV